VNIKGYIKKQHSYNLSASLNAPVNTDTEIIISAHWDSYQSPGADDNGSGIGVLLELARYFKNIQYRIKYNLRFLATGIEELGLLGSQAYIISHSDDLSRIKLLFNIDTIGGSEKIYIEMRGGIQNVLKGKEKINRINSTYLKARTYYSGEWQSSHYDLTKTLASNVPFWLKNIIFKTTNQLDLKITPSQFMGSDHLIFALMGVPSTNISISGNKTHSPDDTPDKINLDSLEKAGKIVASVILKTMQE
jgi:Zn-dependent M28 family amino/carboxypeptidase